MTPQKSTFQAFVKLGRFLTEYLAKKNNPDTDKLLKFQSIVSASETQNSWFTPNNIDFALEQWSLVLTETHLKNWLNPYKINPSAQKRKVAIIMAGNIPLVGFHDFLCVLMSGNQVVCKLSSNDKLLLPFLSGILIEHAPELESDIIFTEEKLTNFDAVIATGSNNTSRYFDYYFGKYPNIIRKNRNSVAILSGNESPEELQLLGKDIFRYFGLGCRNVSKLYVPDNYNFDGFFEAIFSNQDIIHQHKYANNYDYNKAVYLMSNIPLLDNGFLVLKEDEQFSSPIACLFYEYYSDKTTLKNKLEAQEEHIQCIVSKGWSGDEISFGQTQIPNLSDYADGIDTLDFLLSLN